MIKKQWGTNLTKFQKVQLPGGVTLNGEKIYSDAINSDNEEDIRLVMDILLPSMKFPIIITSGDEISAVLNLDISEKEGTPLYKQKTTVTMQEMDKNFQPLALYWNEVQWGKIHYADPQVVNQLRWIPYFEVSFGLVFIVLTLWGFQLIRKSEKNLIYILFYLFVLVKIAKLAY